MSKPKFEKFGFVQKMAADQVDMDKINAQTLVALSAGSVFTFRIAACDDQIDRENERFTVECLEELAKLYVGRTVIMDHQWSAKNQTARIYDANMEESDGVHRLILYCYIPRSDATASVIASIEAGILREVSVGCAVGKATCSICGADKTRVFCEHMPGREYDGQLCMVELSEARDAYEVSFCAVPAQKEAGVVKQYGGEDIPAENPDPEENPEIQKALALLELEYKRF